MAPRGRKVRGGVTVRGVTTVAAGPAQSLLRRLLTGRDAGCLTHLESHGIATIEPQSDAEEKWVQHVNEVAAATLFPKADSWYVGANIPGKPRVFMPYVAGVPAYIKICDEIAADGYRGFELRKA